MRRHLLAIALGVVAFGAGDVALADRGAIQDARGDAKAPWDVLSITASNGPTTLRIRMIYRGGLRLTHTSQGLLANIGIDAGAPNSSIHSPDFTVDMLRGSTLTANRLHLLDRASKRVTCRGLRVRVQVQPGILDFVVPQRCLGSKAGRVRLTGFTYSPRGAADEADYLERWSSWIRRG